MVHKFNRTSYLTLTCLMGSVLLSSPALAERFEAQSLVSEATLYPQGAMVTREATVRLPEGQHEIALADILLGPDAETIWNSLQVTVEGATLGPVATGMTEIGEAALYQTPAAQEAKTRLETLQDELRERNRAVEAIRLEIRAAEDTLAYLGRLSEGEGAGAASLAETARLIREESLAARLEAQDATARAEQAERDLKGLKEDIRQAESALSRLAASERMRLGLTLPVEVEQAGEVHISLSYMVATASWAPLYTARLDSEESTLSLTRSVVATQDTGEPWTDVALTFATDDPTRRSVPREVYPQIRRIHEPRPVEPVMRTMASDAMEQGYAAPVMEQPMVEAMKINLAGLSQTYSYPTPATLYSGEDAVEFGLSTLDLSPEVFVRAVPLYEEVGYLMASFANDSGEMLVPGTVRLFRDGVSLGETSLDTLVDGAEAELAFGPVDGITMERVLLTRNEGDRGVISKSNETETEWRIEVANLTARSWPIKVLDRVSVSEQDELKVDWSASPAPDVEGVDDKRGVLAWHFDLEAGESQEISLSENLRWPEGKVLQ
ncbi:DUF4139 domain-containing protein [uncultured Celeribacter sp.]|uniref:DUF4139 domain-containing protein n=1 Tax=uncultured Celeribacter sp. TaxID=1303376 RepID=UPI002AA8F586|nr:DUF4139 domain-containing protein [uncultured Celeribacter sp.]